MYVSPTTARFGTIVFQAALTEKTKAPLFLTPQIWRDGLDNRVELRGRHPNNRVILLQNSPTAAELTAACKQADLGPVQAALTTLQTEIDSVRRDEQECKRLHTQMHSGHPKKFLFSVGQHNTVANHDRNRPFWQLIKNSIYTAVQELKCRAARRETGLTVTQETVAGKPVTVYHTKAPKKRDI